MAIREEIGDPIEVPVLQKTWSELSAMLAARDLQNAILRAALGRIVKLKGGVTDRIARKALKQADSITGAE